MWWLTYIYIVKGSPSSIKQLTCSLRSSLKQSNKAGTTTYKNVQKSGMDTVWSPFFKKSLDWECILTENRQDLRISKSPFENVI